ncbi:MAG: AEC family transporter [Desulfobulbaceae bacterium]|nr:AEC family transporter [Desulfobulbaceae bacterium]
MENFLITFAYLLFGMGCKRLRSFPDQTGTVLNLFVIYLSLPALVLLKIPELTFSSRILAPLLLPWLMLAVSAGLVLVLARLCNWDRPTTGCLLLLVPLGNTGFLGIPMVRAFFGEAAIPYAVLYDQFGSFLALATYGSLVLALYGSGGERPSFSGVAKKIATFPPFLALLTALVLKNHPYPEAVTHLCQALAATLVPVVMIAVGYQLTLRLNRAVLGQMGLGLLIKLVAAPLLALLLCRLAGLSDEPARVAIFEAGMPPMVSAGALAILADLSPPLTAALVGVGIILSFATLPLLHQLL